METDLKELIILSEEIEKAPQILAKDLELSSEQYPYNLSLRNSGFEEEKEKDRFIRACVRMVRSSPEYRLWVDYIKDVSGIHDCAITGEKGTQVTIEMHHHPITLYEIIKAIVSNCDVSIKEYCSFDISTEVIEHHYNDKIGYIPLAITLHEKYHNGFLNLPIELVRGDWKYLLNKYEWEDDELSNIKARLKINKKNCGWIQGYKWIEKLHIEGDINSGINQSGS